jgi:hypothetical protein
MGEFQYWEYQFEAYIYVRGFLCCTPTCEWNTHDGNTTNKMSDIYSSISLYELVKWPNTEKKRQKGRI